KNREMWDCIVCHQPGSKILAYDGQPYPTRPVKNHDIPELHKAADSECGPCHAQSYTREHARSGRTDSSGNAITCKTCHEHSDTKILNAISSKNTNCASCHNVDATGTAHAEFHEVSYGAKCVECHGSNMLSETQYHAANGCDTCHESSNSQVTEAILRQKDSCFDCHSQPHGVQMVSYRADIPLYSGFSWGIPQEATVWASEGWLPENLNSQAGKVLFSSRTQVDFDTVYNYYINEMNTAGWILKEKIVDADKFKLHYTKDRRSCVIWLYSGTSPGSSDGQYSGVRMTIAYH
ncbi:MAG: cytochrome c3 family protein, partial [Bacillota bacterium]|nr:cytochrome c3 family protein [Bacillota bacterium]